MPQRFPSVNGPVVGLNWDLKKSKARPMPARAAAALALSQAAGPCVPRIENLESREMLSASYFVSPGGSDNNVGSLAAPFKTIQAAANVATAGDFVEIESGTYHEAVTPKHSGTPGSPITYEAYNHENVTITGADAVTGWSSYNSTISQAAMPTDLGQGNNQVFVDGRAINEARFPNSSLDISHPTTETMTSTVANSSAAVIYDPNLTQPANYWKGSIIHFNPGQAWVDQTGIVTSSSPGSVSISYQSSGKYGMPTAGNQFYIEGKFQQLNTAGTWYRDPGTGQLYVWTPTGDSAANHDVEVKNRQYAFDLHSDQHDITINGVNIFASTIVTGHGSSDVTINGVTASYVSQFMSTPNGWWVNPVYGITLKGAHDVLENSTVQYSSGDGVEVSGAGAIVTNNIIHDVDTVGADLAGVRVLGGGDVQISHNTVYNAGRDGIMSLVPRAQITYNTVHDIGLQTTEPGGIYTVGTVGAVLRSPTMKSTISTPADMAAQACSSTTIPAAGASITISPGTSITP